MHRKSLSQHVTETFDDLQLTDRQLKQLQGISGHETVNLNASNDDVKADRSDWFDHLTLNKIAASFIILAAMVFFLVPAYSTKTITQEVAYNHVHLKPLAVRTSNIGEIKNQLSELKFMPIVSNYFSRLNGRLLGGRYCSIQKSLAVLLRYDNGNGKSSTLYQTAYDASKFSSLPDVDKGLEPVEHSLNGLHIRLWIEKGLVFASVNE